MPNKSQLIVALEAFRAKYFQKENSVMSPEDYSQASGAGQHHPPKPENEKEELDELTKKDKEKQDKEEVERLKKQQSGQPPHTPGVSGGQVPGGGSGGYKPQNR